MPDDLARKCDRFAVALLVILKQAFLTVVWLTVGLAVLAFWHEGPGIGWLVTVFFVIAAFYGLLVWHHTRRRSDA